MKNFIIAVITVAASYVVGGDLGITIALLGGLAINALAFKELREEKDIHIDTAEVLAFEKAEKGVITEKLNKTSAMLDRVQKETLELNAVIKSQAIKIQEFHATEAIGNSLPEAEAPIKKPRKTTLKKTK